MAALDALHDAAALEEEVEGEEAADGQHDEVAAGHGLADGEVPGGEAQLGAGIWAAAAAAAAEGPPDAVVRLEQRRRELRCERDATTRQLRNEERKRARLMETARRLSDEDLISIVASRAAAKAKAEAQGKANCKPKANAKAQVEA